MKPGTFLIATAGLSLILLQLVHAADDGGLSDFKQSLEPIVDHDFDPDSIEALQKAFPGVKPVIPLNTEDPTYDLWRMKRKDLGAGREPGPINIQRFPGGFAAQGVPTFFGLPIALTPEDLKAGDVDVALIGATTNMGTGNRGAQWGPRALRSMSEGGDYLTWGAYTMPHMGTLVDPFADMVMVDYGDAPVDLFNTHRSFAAQRAVFREIMEVERSDGTRVIPFVIGGDHSLSYPSLAAAADVYGKGNVGVIHFDAHFDGSMYLGSLATHGAWVKQLMIEGHVPGKNYVQVALRGYYPDAATFEWMREEQFRYHTMSEIVHRGWKPVMEDIIKEAQDGPEYLYVSFDIDAMDPVYTSGTGTPEPGGMTNIQAFEIMRRLCAETNVIGVDVLELAPGDDPTKNTILNTNRLVRNCLVGIAIRKAGIDQPDYRSPLTVDDGRN